MLWALALGAHRAAASVWHSSRTRVKIGRRSSGRGSFATPALQRLQLPRLMTVAELPVMAVRLSDIVPQRRLPRLIFAAQCDLAVHVPFLVAHDLDAPGCFESLRALQRDVVDVRPVIGIEGHECSRHWVICVPAVDTAPLPRSGKETLFRCVPAHRYQLRGVWQKNISKCECFIWFVFNAET